MTEGAPQRPRRPLPPARNRGRRIPVRRRALPPDSGREDTIAEMLSDESRSQRVPFPDFELPEVAVHGVELEASAACDLLPIIFAQLVQRLEVTRLKSVLQANERLRCGYLAIAGIIERSVAECGPETDLADDDALDLIRTILLTVDESMLGDRWAEARWYWLRDMLHTAKEEGR